MRKNIMIGLKDLIVVATALFGIWVMKKICPYSYKFYSVYAVMICIVYFVLR